MSSRHVFTKTFMLVFVMKMSVIRYVVSCQRLITLFERYFIVVRRKDFSSSARRATNKGRSVRKYMTD